MNIPELPEVAAMRWQRSPALRGCISAQQGFSLFEMVVVIVLIAILGAVALSRLWDVRAAAEHTAMDNVLGGLRSALGMKVAHYIAEGREDDMQILVGTNPMDYLAEIPKNYVGALREASPASVAAGNWYFDLRSRTLVYRVENADSFTGGGGPPALVRFAIQPVYGESHGGRAAIQGVRLVALEPYTWAE